MPGYRLFSFFVWPHFNIGKEKLSFFFWIGLDSVVCFFCQGHTYQIDEERAAEKICFGLPVNFLQWSTEGQSIQPKPKVFDYLILGL